MTKCIRYWVDPALLNAGIPIEQLEKRNIQEFLSGETMQHLNRYSQGTERLCKDKSLEHFPKPVNRLEIELSPSNYNKVLSGQLIKISASVTKHQGEKFKIINKKTGSYVVRTLCVINGPLMVNGYP